MLRFFVSCISSTSRFRAAKLAEGLEEVYAAGGFGEAAAQGEAVGGAVYGVGVEVGAGDAFGGEVGQGGGDEGAGQPPPAIAGVQMNLVQDAAAGGGAAGADDAGQVVAGGAQEEDGRRLPAR